MPSYLFIGGFGVLIIAMFAILVRKALSTSKESGKLAQELKDVETENDLQEKYMEISARPSDNADALLERMRNGSNDNK